MFKVLVTTTYHYGLGSAAVNTIVIDFSTFIQAQAAADLINSQKSVDSKQRALLLSSSETAVLTNEPEKPRLAESRRPQACCECGEDYPADDLFVHGAIFCSKCRVTEAARLPKYPRS